MKYAIFFVAGSAAAIWAAFQGSALSLLLLWPGASLATVALGYSGSGPKVFGKRPSGTLAPVTALVLAPYLTLTWLVWHCSRVLRREMPFNRLTPGITIGRRLLGSEYTPHIKAVVDLTAEFQEPKVARTGREYWAFPILDGSVPKADALLDLLAEIREFPGEVYIHCAEGHGRTALVAAALLLVRGDAGSVEEAVRRVLDQRPRAYMNRAQLTFLGSLAAGMHTGGAVREVPRDGEGAS